MLLADDNRRRGSLLRRVAGPSMALAAVAAIASVATVLAAGGAALASRPALRPRFAVSLAASWPEASASAAHVPAQAASAGFCNASASVPGLEGNFTLELTEPQRQACYNFTPRDDFPQWEGQNNCWEWTKTICHKTQPMGALSWQDAQRRASLHLPLVAVGSLKPLRNPEVCERYAPEGWKAADFGPAEWVAADIWFKQNVAVFVLNMPNDVKRLEAISARLSALNLIFERIEGVDLSAKGAFAAARRDGLIPSTFDAIKAQASARTPYQDIGGIVGTVGCAAAHLKAMGTAAAAPRPLALILEDDAMLADDFPARLRRLLQSEAPCDWESISLKSKCPYGACVSPRLSRVLPDENEPADRCRHGVNYGFYAMLYRVSALPRIREQLSDVIWDDTRPHCLDIDVALASISDEVPYYAVPSMQRDAFLTEGDHGSSRMDKNREGVYVNLEDEEEQASEEEKLLNEAWSTVSATDSEAKATATFTTTTKEPSAMSSFFHKFFHPQASDPLPTTTSGVALPGGMEAMTTVTRLRDLQGQATVNIAPS